ncbi:hypothetical protein BH11ACT4_BH11ACT4_02860 [soil metagenome]
MRRFIFNTSILGAIFGVFGVVQSTRRGPRDWRLVLAWISWGLTVAIAVGTVIEDSKTQELEN